MLKLEGQFYIFAKKKKKKIYDFKLLQSTILRFDNNGLPIGPIP